MDFTRIIQKNTNNPVFIQKLFDHSKEILLVIFIGFSLITNAQSGPDFTILADKAFLKLYQNSDECISYTQGILVSDQNTEHKMILQNIISQAFAMKGDYVQSVNIFAQKEDPEHNNLSYFMQIFGDYNLADQYQNLGLYNQSKRIISYLLSDQKLLKSNDATLRVTTAKLYQLQALNSGINRDYPTALQNLDKSNQYLSGQNEENKILKLENRIFRSSYLLKQNKLIEYQPLIKSIIDDLEHQKNQPFLLGLAYENLSQYYFLKQDYRASVEKLEAGLSLIEDLPFNNLKIKIYESLSRSYYALHDDAKYHQYNKLYNDLKTKTDASSREGIRYLVKLVETSQNKNIEFQKLMFVKSFWPLALILSLIILGLFAYFLSIKSKGKDLKKQFDFFEKQISRKSQSAIPEKVTATAKDSGSTKISREKEDEILRKLEEFEKSGHYLNKNMSLSMLSSQMEVNTKYLSEVINNKEKNFNGYINKLRINHIVQLLKNDSTFLNYKVSYLAEYSGFSSHSAFTTVFKSVTGMSPNTYIQEISKSKTV
ncbi:DNA-binding transcriptional regulator MelR [Chryseobacterium gleum]|uniref:DNA-binding transcriptional regulator MelR n=2 Tax=Chryseobacterium gleum TaxID=250 RepID=A0A448B1U8_CHRGE|nr:AraC family transcriptional regulator [Chryseobacterium gleum]EFK33292.1 transcriptional regulator, AraC family [Chryseobacterium gleum ATCC 35910]QQY34091.1 helix-turn-helix transcriptional regulator [Chryseobacterium gleum]VEE07328.1 DNA-binding transcriptional regulator MelR [Chryseobacterium gleum]